MPNIASLSRPRTFPEGAGAEGAGAEGAGAEGAGAEVGDGCLARKDITRLSKSIVAGTSTDYHIGSLWACIRGVWDDRKEWSCAAL